MAESYDGADRCPSCPGRACLTEQGALRLAQHSRGRLDAFRCPKREGWHVRAPAIETPRPTGRR